MLRLKSLKRTRTARQTPRVNSGSAVLRKCLDLSRQACVDIFTIYAVTYVKAFEESPESEWSDTVEIPQKCTTVKVRKMQQQQQRYAYDFFTLIFDRFI